ncbi:MAG: Uma2 family endonuclease [Eubacteriales bacterium]|nr:Uma2 family endonuclease [Eubacteriales bacterium]
MTIDEMRKIKDERGYSIAVLSKYSGVPTGTLTKIFSGETKVPRAATLSAIERVLLSDEQKIQGKAAQYNEKAEYKSEASVPYYLDGGSDHTMEEYFALPDDIRMELIDGKFYYMESPAYVHQAIAGYVYAALLYQITEKGGNCMPFISPVSVQLDMDDKTVVQPDVMISCRRDKLKYRIYRGAPDFMMEVLSPSTRKKDLTLKTAKYVNAGVREYVIIDPEKRRLMSYRTDNEFDLEILPLEGKYALDIYNGEITIDLDHINKLIDDMPGKDEV